MKFSEEFLRALCAYEIIGDFYPFNTGNETEVEKYIRQLVKRIKDNGRLRMKDSRHISVEAVFDHYGSGTASYVDVSIWKTDQSDTKIIVRGDEICHDIKGLRIYISRLTPYWFFGVDTWTGVWRNGRYCGGSHSYLHPEHLPPVDTRVWDYNLTEIQKIFDEFGYTLLPTEALNERLWFDVEIPTVLVYDGKKVFDCFFYWED